jgi:hypothetical protein
MTMTKTMPGVLEFPSSYQVMDAEEMMYVEGGKVTISNWTYKTGSAYCAGLAALYFGQAGLYGYAAAVAGAVTAGIGFIFGVPAAYRGYCGAQYIAAYNKIQSWTSGGTVNKWCNISETTLLGLLTGVDVEKA